MQTVILDTNALLMPFEVKINLDISVMNLLGDTHMVVPEPLLGELKRSKHKFSKAALGLAMKYEIIQTDKRGDDAVLDVALKLNGFILTNDRELRKRARMQNIPIIYLRSGTHLIIDN